MFWNFKNLDNLVERSKYFQKLCTFLTQINPSIDCNAILFVCKLQCFFLFTTSCSYLDYKVVANILFDINNGFYYKDIQPEFLKMHFILSIYYLAGPIQAWVRTNISYQKGHAMHHFYKYETELVQLTLGNFGNFKKYAKCYGIYRQPISLSHSN